MFCREGIRKEARGRWFWTAAVLIAFAALLAAAEAKAADWAKAMFDETSHDFGMVARGAKAEFRFTIENIYVEDAHIKSVSSSCHCTEVELTEASLKTHEKAQIVAKLNTTQFSGSRDATIRVVFDKPFPAEVQLHVQAYIRTDVVLEPGSVRFGQVTEGTEVTKTIDLRHAGKPDWKITGYENEDEHISVAIKPVEITSSQAAYQLAFTLKPTAPVGYIRRHVTLLTNDQNPSAQRVLIPIEGVVVSAVSVRPSPVAFGLVPVGRQVTRNVVVQGLENFQILKVTGPDDRFGTGPSVKLNASSRVHLLPITFTAGKEPGKIEGEILIETDIEGGRTLRVNVSGEVIDVSQNLTPVAPAAKQNAPDEQDKKSSDGWRRAGE